ncbi:MAG TPA: hypothetical protein VG407_13155 [Caulobacteraceae bacterium]|nr:hypothetical protein [Caulobacteraceae bacterium]
MFRAKPVVLALATLGAMALSGCNLVISAKPVFDAADASGAPGFRPGVWASPDQGCSFDEAKPAGEWPSCASGAVIMDDKAWAVGHKEKASAFILAAGDPRVMQAIADLSDMNGSNVTVTEKGPIYLFIAVNPLAKDGDGRITKAEAWFIQCGPPPPKPKDGTPASNDPKAYGTTQPLPGMTMDNGECSPKDKAAVRAAAGPSRAWADQLMQMHWVRAGES